MMVQRRKLVIMLISVLAAIVLWLYVVTVVAPEASTRVSGIPINIDGTIVLEERDLVITSQDVDSLSMEVSTSRVNLSKLNADSIRVNADASRIRSPGQYPLSCTVTFPDTVRNGDVNILRKSVDAVTITVERLTKKNFPIQLNWTGSIREGYLFDAGSAVMEPAEVTVVGLEAEVGKIAKVVVDYNVSGLEETVIKTVPIRFLDENDEEISFSELTTPGFTETSLTLPVLRTRELTLALDFIEGGGVTADNAEVQFEFDTVQVKGPADVIDALDDKLVVGTVNLSEISNFEELTFALDLPAGVNNMSGETEVKATIRLVGVSTDTLPVTDIRLANIPAGYTAESSTRTVHVTLRGSADEIKEILKSRDNGFYVLVDLSDYTQTGAFPVTGKVINTSHPSISVVENVEINVSISQITEEENEGNED